MAHSSSTDHYNLPQFAAADKPAWLTDVNPAYSAIDAGIYAAQQAADDAQDDATQALDDAAAASGAATTADSKASGAVASIADAFDPTSIYSAGDVVIYNNLLYICILDVTTPGPWTGSGNWNRTTIENLLEHNNDSLDFEIINSVDPVTGVNWTAKKYNNGDLEIWGHKRFTPDSEITFGTWGNVYSTAFDVGTWPIAFIDVPACVGQIQIENVGCVSSAQATVSTTIAPPISAIRGAAGSIATNLHINLSMFARGRWRV